MKATHTTYISAIYLNIVEAHPLSVGKHLLICEAKPAVTKRNRKQVDRSLLPMSLLLVANNAEWEGQRQFHQFSVYLEDWASDIKGRWWLQVSDHKPEAPERIRDVPGVIMINTTPLCELAKLFPKTRKKK